VLFRSRGRPRASSARCGGSAPSPSRRSAPRGAGRARAPAGRPAPRAPPRSPPGRCHPPGSPQSGACPCSSSLHECRYIASLSTEAGGRGQPRRADTAQLGPNARLTIQRPDPASRGCMRFGMRWLLLLLALSTDRVRRPAPLRAAPRLLGAVLATVGIALPAQARVERIEFLERAPFAAGAAFGEVGSYERIIGRLHFAVDPDDPANGAIVDLALAPRDGRGL